MITYRSSREIQRIRESCRLVAEALQHLQVMIEPGRSTAELDRVAENFIRKQGGLPAFKGYRGFPATLCTSINSEVVHGFHPGKESYERETLSALTAVQSSMATMETTPLPSLWAPSVTICRP